LGVRIRQRSQQERVGDTEDRTRGPDPDRERHERREREARRLEERADGVHGCVPPEVSAGAGWEIRWLCLGGGWYKSATIPSAIPATMKEMPIWTASFPTMSREVDSK